MPKDNDGSAGDSVISVLTRMTAQEVVRVANIRDAAAQLKAASKLFIFAYFASLYGLVAITSALTKHGVPDHLAQAHLQNLKDESAKLHEAWLDRAKTDTTNIQSENRMTSLPALGKKPGPGQLN